MGKEIPAFLLAEKDDAMRITRIYLLYILGSSSVQDVMPVRISSRVYSTLGANGDLRNCVVL
jgi:hypothetical protein